MAFSSLDYIGFQTNLANDEVAYQNAFIGALDILGTAQATAEPSRVSNLAEVTRMHDVSQAYAQEGLAGLFSQEYETFQNSDDAASYTNSMHTQLDDYFSAFNDSEKQHIQDRANAEVLETQAAGVFEQQFDTTLNEQLQLKHDNQTQHRTQYQLTSSANWLNQVSFSWFTARSPWHQHLYETTLADDAFAQDETTGRSIPAKAVGPKWDQAGYDPSLLLPAENSSSGVPSTP